MAGRWRWTILAVLALGLIVAGKALVRADHRVRIGGPPHKRDDPGPIPAGSHPAADDLPPSVQELSHAAFDKLLRRYVDDAGRVDYAAWKSTPTDIRALDAYLDSLTTPNFRRPMSRAALAAYWINAYNALTIKAVLGVYPTTSIRDHTKWLGYNLRRDLVLWADGQYLSLNMIQSTRLGTLGDPRVVFAAGGAARGGPPLARSAYTAQRLDDQLDAAARRFFAAPDRFQADPARHQLRLSPVLRWSAAELGATEADRLRAIAAYLPADARPLVSDPAVRVSYLDYDWRLNDTRN